MRIAASIGLAGLATLLATGAARADVFEVGSDGAVRTRSGVAAVTWNTDVDPTDTEMAEAAPDVPAAAVTTIESPKIPVDYAQSLAKAASDYQISPSLLAALVGRESGWRTTALSNKGAIGLTQLMPATARAMQIDPRDAAANLAGGARYLRQMLDLFDGNVERALAAYNAGPGRVIRAGGVPAIAETRAYVATIIGRLGAAWPTVSAASPLGVIR